MSRWRSPRSPPTRSTSRTSSISTTSPASRRACRSTSAVAFYVDGFFVSDNSSLNSDLANLANIQVLKGPQGTLYGRQAAGGAILVNTLDPSEELSGKFEGRYGRFKERRLTGYLSGPISEKLGFMVAGSYRKTDGYLKRADPANPTRTIGPAGPRCTCSCSGP